MILKRIITNADSHQQLANALSCLAEKVSLGAFARTQAHKHTHGGVRLPVSLDAALPILRVRW